MNPLKVKQSLIAAVRVRNPNPSLNKPALWRTQRSYAEVHLTLEGVTALQHDKRIHRDFGAIIGASAGAFVGIEAGFGIIFPA